jgi:predicted Rossmann fold flavoprotein
MDNYPVAIVGGGPAGICAAIAVCRAGDRAVICEKMPQLGKKILATGNGRCNLLNDKLDETHYNPAAAGVVRSIFTRFGKTDILSVFDGLGLEVYSRESRLFPVTNQAASVLKVLEMELKRLSVAIEYGFDCSGVSLSKTGILVTSKAGGTIECRKVIITGGGMALPASGSDGGIYEVARQLGHTIVPPVPAAVPLLINDKLCHFLQGQRISASAWSVIDGKQGNTVPGELLFTKYGLSGTCILDVSRDVSVAINRDNRTQVFVAVDLVPFMNEEQLNNELVKRLKARQAPEEMMVGILPNKLSAAFKDIFTGGSIEAAAHYLKAARFKISGTREWNEAEYTAGGINLQEVNPYTLESRLGKNVYFAGEILDVDGERGGYNLAWAWASGFVAGMAKDIS